MTSIPILLTISNVGSCSKGLGALKRQIYKINHWMHVSTQFFMLLVTNIMIPTEIKLQGWNKNGIRVSMISTLTSTPAVIGNQWQLPAKITCTVLTAEYFWLSFHFFFCSSRCSMTSYGVAERKCHYMASGASLYDFTMFCTITTTIVTSSCDLFQCSSTGRKAKMPRKHNDLCCCLYSIWKGKLHPFLLRKKK